MPIYGIDVSSNQPANICKLVSYDFAIVKATGNPSQYNWDYVNPYMEQQASDAYAKTKKVGPIFSLTSYCHAVVAELADALL